MKHAYCNKPFQELEEKLCFISHMQSDLLVVTLTYEERRRVSFFSDGTGG
jgi:hypothetical protein